MIRLSFVTRALCGAALSGSLLSTVGWASSAETTDRIAEIAVLPSAAARGLGIATPGTDLPQGGWQALVCQGTSCELRAADVAISTPQDSEQQVSEQMHVAVAQHQPLVQGEYVLVFLHGFADAVAKSVVTWHTRRTPRLPADESNGSLGITVRAAQGRSYSFLPRWNSVQKALNFYLETPGHRQQLGSIALNILDTGLKPRDLLLWAGDIDADGRLDLITSLNGNLVLWLASRAAPATLLGEAAALRNWAEVQDESD